MWIPCLWHTIIAAKARAGIGILFFKAAGLMSVRLMLLMLLGLPLLLSGCATTAPGEVSGADKAAEQALPKVDPRAKAAYEVALASMRDGNDALAEKQLLKLTEQFPEFSGPHTNLGIIYFRAGEKDKALAAFQRAVELNPNSVVSLNHLGILSREEGKFKEAHGYYENALRIAPDYAYAHLNFGILLELYMGKLPDALTHYKRYQELTKEEDIEVKKWIVDLQRRIK
jgi:tetratricopeptide (TPR) repeat protein